jgi:hypothetical protein
MVIVYHQSGGNPIGPKSDQEGSVVANMLVRATRSPREAEGRVRSNDNSTTSSDLPICPSLVPLTCDYVPYDVGFWRLSSAGFRRRGSNSIGPKSDHGRNGQTKPGDSFDRWLKAQRSCDLATRSFDDGSASTLLLRVQLRASGHGRAAQPIPTDHPPTRTIGNSARSSTGLAQGRGGSSRLASSLGQPVGGLGPSLDVGPVPAGPAADLPFGFGEELALEPAVDRTALDAEAVGDLLDSHGVGHAPRLYRKS